MIIKQFNNRRICVSGVAKAFYQDGFPLSLAVSHLKSQGVEVSLYHVVEELWDNGWNWKTIESKLKGELQDDIDGDLSVDFIKLKEFYDCLEQPFRANGGYEKSRSIIFNYLFGSDAASGNIEDFSDTLKNIVTSL